MPATQQPSGMTGQDGVILTVGVRLNYDRMAIVMPFAAEGPNDRQLMCTDVVNVFESVALPLLLDCMSSDANVSFLQGEGMSDGAVPCRRDYTPTAHPGTLGAPAAPSSVCTLITFYEDVADVVAGQRMAAGRSFIPGVDLGNLAGDVVDPGLVTALQDFANQVQSGLASGGSQTWYRVLGPVKPRADATPIKRTFTVVARGYTATQRRRQIPH